MKAIAIIGALGITLTNGNDIVCDEPYGCAGHNVEKMNCDNEENCAITCSSDFACRDLDIYGPEVTDSDLTERLSLTIDCTAQYSCYGATIHTTNLDSIKVTCSDWWSCAYMTIEGQTANQVLVYVPDEGYYSFGSGKVYCPMSDDTDDNNDKIESDSSVIACSVECNGERSCYHSKFLNNNGLIDSSLVVGCNGALACNFAKLHCNYDSETSEWSKQCTMSCDDDDMCGCEATSDCMIANDNIEE